MTSFEVTDPTLRHALLNHFIERIDDKELLEALMKDGLSATLADHLRYRATPAEVRRAAAVTSTLFTLHFDDESLMSSFSRIKRFAEDERIKDYLSRHGASVELLSRWFSLSKQEANALRDTFGPLRAAGRPKLPEIEVRDSIHAAWAALPAELPEREAFYTLHQKFPDVSVATLYQVVYEHHDGPTHR